MDGVQPVVGYGIAVLLSALAGYFAHQQWLALRRVRVEVDLSAEDQAYVRHQAWLRLSCCGLMVVMALMVAATYAFGLEQRAAELGELLQAQRDLGEDVIITPEQRSFRQLYGIYWIAFLLLLLTTIILAALDIWAIRRYRRRHLHKIESDRKAMLEQHISVLRSQRNGHH